MAKNDTRIKKSYEKKKLGGYINVQTNNNDDTNKENNNITEARFEMIYNSLGILKNFQEIWNYKLNILFDFVNKHKRVPKNKEEHENVKINNWLVDQKKKINSVDDELYKKISTNNTVKTNLDEYLENTKANKKVNKKINTFDESLEIFEKYIKEHNNIPTKKEYCGQWFQDRKKKITTNKDELYTKLSKNKIVKDNLDDYLKTKDINKNKEILSFDESFKLLIDFIKINEKTPKKYEQHKNINIGRWFGTQKNHINSKEDELYKKLSANPIIKDNLDEYLKTNNANKNKEKLSFDDNLKMLIEFIEKNNRIPTKNEKYKNTNIQSWLSNQKPKITSTEDELYKTLSTNKILKSNLDEYLKNKKPKEI